MVISERKVPKGPRPRWRYSTKVRVKSDNELYSRRYPRFSQNNNSVFRIDESQVFTQTSQTNPLNKEVSIIRHNREPSIITIESDIDHPLPTIVGSNKFA